MRRAELGAGPVRLLLTAITAVIVVAGLVLAGQSVLAQSPAGANPPPANPAPANPAPPGQPAPAEPEGGEPAPQANRDQAHVTKTFWYSDRRVALWVYSPAMDTEIQVQLLLARDWYNKPTEKFPQLTLLDGLRARDDQNGWLIETKAETFYRDKNVNVVLPVGGESSFYTDWKKPDNGKNYQWETFLISELPPLLEGDWRSSDVRGVQGLSMGGSAAMMLAARHPGFYKFAASFSGILQLTSYGMPQAIQFALRDGGGYDAAKMFGPPSDPAWAEHDPYELIDKLRGTSLYISSGNGMVGPHDAPSDIPMLATNYSGVGLEVLSRVTSRQFAIRMNEKGIPGRAVYRPSGTHTWAYWEFEMTQAWPQAASALGLAGDKVECGTSPEFGDAAKRGDLGVCLTPEYDVPGGKAQDFAQGRVFTGPEGPKFIKGAIGGSYAAHGGSGGELGLPTSDEMPSRDGRGRVNFFERGYIVWHADQGARVVR